LSLSGWILYTSQRKLSLSGWILYTSQRKLSLSDRIPYIIKVWCFPSIQVCCPYTLLNEFNKALIRFQTLEWFRVKNLSSPCVCRVMIHHDLFCVWIFSETGQHVCCPYTLLNEFNKGLIRFQTLEWFRVKNLSSPCVCRVMIHHDLIYKSNPLLFSRVSPSPGLLNIARPVSRHKMITL
jgi:hypothetical protein